MKFVQLGAWENAYFATRSKSRQQRVNCIILSNLCNSWCLFTLWSWNYQHQGTVLCSQKSKTHSSKKRKADNIHAQQGTSQIKSEIRLLPMSSWTGWLRKHAFAGSKRVSTANLAGPRGLWKVPNLASLVRALIESILTSNFHNVTHKSNGFYMHWKEYSLWNQADRAKISGQISLGACEAARSLEALPPRLRRF